MPHTPSSAWARTRALKQKAEIMALDIEDLLKDLPYGVLKGNNSYAGAQLLRLSLDRLERSIEERDLLGAKR